MFIQIVLVILISAIFLAKHRKDNHGLPPGDWTWPIIGNPILSNDDHMKFVKDQKRKYGPIFRTRMGSRTNIYLTDYPTQKAAFAKTELLARPDVSSFTLFALNFEGCGIGFASGAKWHSNRRFALTHLKDLGMGRSVVEPTIMKEVDAFMDYLANANGESTFIDGGLKVALVNVLWSMIAGRRTEISDGGMHTLTKHTTSLFENSIGPFLLLDYFPLLDSVLPQWVKNKYFGVAKLQQPVSKLVAYMKEIIDEHMENLDRENPKDYIDFYLLEVEKQNRLGEPPYKDIERDLVANLFSLFLGGSDTTSQTLIWFIMLMTIHTDVQEKIHREIDQVLQSRKPTLEDKNRMPYLEATILEVNRKVSLIALGVAHRALGETTLNGYRIPKGAFLIPVIEVLHEDPDFFEQPHQFRPERFIDDDGKVDYTKEGYAPFGLGRRRCLGESLAKSELFLFTSSILQEYNLKAPPGELPDTTPERSFFLNAPKPFKIILEKRTK